VACRLERYPFRYPRWVTGPEADIAKVAAGSGCALLYDAKDHPVLVFADAWGVRWTTEHAPTLTFHTVAP